MLILPRFSILKLSLNRKRRCLLVGLPILVVLSFGFSLAVGSSDVGLGGAVAALLAGDRTDMAYRIVFLVRLPRVLGALLAGGALAASGVMIQGVLNNPMAAPNLIGVNAGAGLAAILAMALFPNLLGILPLAAFVGALLAALLIYAIGMLTGAGKVTITLVGVAVGSILTAAINTVKTLFPDSVYDVSGFLIGGLGNVGFRAVLPAAIMIVPTLLLSMFLTRSLDVLSMGSSVAGGLGVAVRRMRFVWLLLAAILAGAAVSFAGLIGFVGLIVPHLMRRLIGSSHRWLLPLSMLGGSAFLILTDTLSRILFAPYELPVGIVLSLIGGPFFIGLLLAQRRAEL